MFRDRAIFLLVISAILIPLIFITRDLMLTGIFVILFILCQAIMIYLFYTSRKARLEHWYVFWTAILSLVFMLILILAGKEVLTEALGIILFLIYFIGLIILLFARRLAPRKQPKKQEPPEQELEEFREKDELGELVEFFEPKHRADVEVVNIEEPEIERIAIDEPEKSEELTTEEEEASEQLRQELEEMWRKEMPPSVVFDYEEEPKEEEKQELLDRYKEYEEIQAYKPAIKELREAPKVDFEKVRKDLERIDDGVKTISEKIKLISEKAIKEGKAKKAKQEAAKKKPKPKPKKSEMKVHASKTGTRYHYDKNCLGLRRVSKKNLTSYANSKEARKKKLKRCDICK